MREVMRMIDELPIIGADLLDDAVSDAYTAADLCVGMFNHYQPCPSNEEGSTK
jgi:hypothetical protein